MAASNAALPEESSDDEGGYTIEQGLADWVYSKSVATKRSYLQFCRRFRAFLTQNYCGKDLDSVRKRHIRAFLANLSTTNASTRHALCIIKSVCGHLAKLGILRKDPSVGFKLPQQLAPRVERSLDSAAVRALFRIARERRNKSTFHVLQVLTYAGLRLTACCSLKRTDIHRVEGANSKACAPKAKTYSYFLRVRKAKGGKTRKIYLKGTIGKSLYDYAQTVKSTYLFPGKKTGSHISATAIYCRIKTLGKKISKPEISPHWFRHFFASYSLANGAPLVSVSRTMGHSSVNVTSLYLHERPGTSVSSFIDLASSSADDESQISVDYPVKKIEKVRANSA